MTTDTDFQKKSVSLRLVYINLKLIKANLWKIMHN